MTEMDGVMASDLTARPRRQRQGSLVVVVASLVGVAGFLYPFLLPAIKRTDNNGSHASDAPILLAAITGLCVLAVLVELSASGPAATARSKTVALLGVLVATDAALRLAPSFVGATPIFLLIVLVGYVYGPAFGFQMGAMTLLVSAFLTGGIGPWLPYEMLGAGWVGLTAGWLPEIANPRRRLLVLAGFSAVWGLLYGAILDLWFWPFLAPGLDVSTGITWAPGLSPAAAFAHFARFYLITSLPHDLFRAGGNVVLMLVLGEPLLRVLLRFRRRFSWEPWEEMAPAPAAEPAPPGLSPSPTS